MPDDEGILHLEDLHEPAQEDLIQPKNGANNAYWFYSSSKISGFIVKCFTMKPLAFFTTILSTHEIFNK